MRSAGSPTFASASTAACCSRGSMLDAGGGDGARVVLADRLGDAPLHPHIAIAHTATPSPTSRLAARARPCGFAVSEFSRRHIDGRVTERSMYASAPSARRDSRRVRTHVSSQGAGPRLVAAAAARRAPPRSRAIGRGAPPSAWRAARPRERRGRRTTRASTSSRREHSHGGASHRRSRPTGCTRNDRKGWSVSGAGCSRSRPPTRSDGSIARDGRPRHRSRRHRGEHRGARRRRGAIRRPAHRVPSTRTSRTRGGPSRVRRRLEPTGRRARRSRRSPTHRCASTHADATRLSRPCRPPSVSSASRISAQ